MSRLLLLVVNMKSSSQLNEEKMEQVAEKISNHLYKMATLFSGAGGLDLGFIRTEKFESVIANDLLDAPAHTYSKNHNRKIVTVKEFNANPKVPCYIKGDVSSIDFQLLKNIDCVIGGPPCQDFSITRGKRDKLGIHMKRGKLYSHFVRALTRTNPPMFVFENVPGLRSSNKGRAYQTIKKDFENLNVRWSEIKHDINKGPKDAESYFLIFNDIVNSSNVGVPQKRRRLIIIGVRKDLINPEDEKELAEKAESILEGSESLLSKYPLTAMEVLEGKTIPELGRKYEEVMKEYDGVEKETNTPESAKKRFNAALRLIQDIFDDIKDVRWHYKHDFYSLFTAFAELSDSYHFPENKYSKIRSKLVIFGKKVDMLSTDEGKKKRPSIDVRQYFEAVHEHFTNKPQREKRTTLIQELIIPYLKNQDTRRDFTEYERRIIWAHSKTKKCHICHKIVVRYNEYEAHHKIPFERGGKTELKNGVVTHKRCNRKLQDKVKPSRRKIKKKKRTIRKKVRARKKRRR